MNENMRKYMKVGIVHFMAYPEVQTGYGPIEETVKKIAVDDYFEAIEVTWIKDALARKNVKNIVESSHLELFYAGMPPQKITGININDLAEQKRRRAVELLKKGINEAYELNATGFAFMSGKFNQENMEAHYRALIKSTIELCDYASTKGDMKLSLEVFDNDVDTCSLIGPAEIARRYSDEICADYPNFGLMVDLSHLPQLRESPAESLIPVKKNINHAHIGNALVTDSSHPLYGDKHPRFGYPGSANDVEQLIDYLRVLLEIGYLNEKERRNLSIEVRPEQGEDVDLIIANAKRVLNQAWILV